LAVVLVGFAVGLSNFGASIGIGLAGVTSGLRLRIAGVFGFFETAMPLAGLLIGARLAGLFGSMGRPIGGLFLVAVGVYTLWQSSRVRIGGEALWANLTLRQLVVAGFVLGIDNLVAGFALGASSVPVVFAAVIIGAVSVFLSLVGLELGHRLGRFVERWSEALSGLVFVAIGVALVTGLVA
jgi:putative Mn2+ efflux pump MntP